MKNRKIKIITYLILIITVLAVVLGAGGKIVKPAAAAVNACDNPYYPLKAGDEIEYQSTGAGGKTTHTMKVVEATGESAKIKFTFSAPSEVTMTQNIFCEGGRVRTDAYIDLTSGAGGVQMKSETEGVEGDLMPKDPKVGSTWTTRYSMTSKFEGVKVPGNFEGMKMALESVNKVLAEEKITVPAGTYTALKVEVVSSMKMSMPGLPVPIPPSSMTFHEWWVKGVGLVKVASADSKAGKWETVATRVKIAGGIPFLDNPTVEAVAEKAVAPAAVAVAAANTVIASQATISIGIGRYLLFFLTQPLLLIKRRKRKAWGTIYNALSRLPEDLVIVRLRDEATGKIVGSEVTDRAGRFSFLVSGGKYRLEAIKSNFVFPSVLTKGKKEDGQFLDVYHGEAITVKTEGAVLTPNIPVDPIVKEAPDAAILKRDSWRRIQGAVALSGPALGAVSFVIKPSLFVGLLFVLGILVYLFFRRFAVIPAPKNWGIVREEETTKGVATAVLRIFALPYDKLLDSKVADGRGRYNFRVGNSKFYLTVTKEGYKKAQTDLFDFSAAAEPKIIAEDISLKKN